MRSLSNRVESIEKQTGGLIVLWRPDSTNIQDTIDEYCREHGVSRRQQIAVLFESDANL